MFRIFLLTFLLTSCALAPDDWGVSIEDMEGMGNPDIEECQITFGGEVPMVPCTIELNFEWDL